MDTTIPTVNRRPGKLWAFLQFPLTRFLLAFFAIFIWIGAIQVGSKLVGVAPESPLGAMLGLLIAVGVLVIYVFYVRLLERRTAVELAAKGAQRHAARGILVGAALFCTTMLVLKLLGAWSYTGTYPLSALAFPFAGAVFAALVEETVVRGLLFRILEESLGSWIALGLSALIFGLLHAGNHGATLVSTSAIALEAGVLLAAAYMYTRSLWFVMGLHFAWNFTEGGVFATSVSGHAPEGVIGVQFTGPELLTGGAFGPEASLAAVVICLAAGVAFIILAVRTDRVVEPFWMRNT
ncbi:MAG TPA: type II CAAX endopeptidase family protein [Gammaproteobacteria bacterium]